MEKFHFIALKTLLLLQDGSLHLFQCFSSKIYSWDIPPNEMEKIGIVAIYPWTPALDRQEALQYVCPNGCQFLKSFVFKKNDLISHGCASWKVRFVSHEDIRQYAYMKSFGTKCISIGTMCSLWGTKSIYLGTMCSLCGTNVYI